MEKRMIQILAKYMAFSSIRLHLTIFAIPLKKKPSALEYRHENSGMNIVIEKVPRINKPSEINPLKKWFDTTNQH